MGHSLWLHLVLLLREVEQLWERLTIWQSSVWVPQLIEVGVQQATQWSRSNLGVIREQLRDKVDGLPRSTVPEHFLPWKRSDLWESILFVVGVHCLNLFFRWSSEDLDDLHELVNTALSWEDRLTKHELGDDAAN